MDRKYCDKCGKWLKDGADVIAITSGTINPQCEGFEPDSDPYIMLLCGNCCDISKAIIDAPRADRKPSTLAAGN